MNLEGLKSYFDNNKFDINNIHSLICLYAKTHFIQTENSDSFNVINDKLTENDKQILNKIIKESDFIKKEKDKEIVIKQLKKEIIKLVYDNLKVDSLKLECIENKAINKINEDNFHYISDYEISKEIQSYY